MLISFLRSLILYLIVIFGLRIMGKRQLGQLQPSELVITILISNIATLPIENSDVPLILGIVPILTLMCFEVILSVCALKNLKLRRLIWGNTRVVIQDGKLDQQELADLRYSVDDLMSSCASTASLTCGRWITQLPKQPVSFPSAKKPNMRRSMHRPCKSS